MNHPVSAGVSLIAQLVKNLNCNAGDPDVIPGSGRSPGEENGSPFQSSCLENPMDGGAWQATVHGVPELEMTERLTLSHLDGAPQVRAAVI